MQRPTLRSMAAATEIASSSYAKPAALICRRRRPIVSTRAQATLNEGPDYSRPTRNLALDLVRVTEAAALAGGRWYGKGDKNAADQAAVDAMRRVLRTVTMNGIVVIGEGEKDEAPMLFVGEAVGDGAPGAPLTDIAVDPLDGTTLTAQGRSGAVSVIAVAPRGALFDPGPCMYMDKLAVGPKIDPDTVSLDNTVKQNLMAVAYQLEKPISDVTVVILDRPRHAALIQECRRVGVRVRLISDGDVASAIETAKPGSPVDIMLGVGGTPEGVIAAAAMKCMGGTLQGRLAPRNDDELKRTLEKGYDITKILLLEDLCKGDDVFFAATGVSDGDLLRGVRYFSGGASTNSLVMRGSSGTIRYVETYHKWDKPSIVGASMDGQLVAARRRRSSSGDGNDSFSPSMNHPAP